MAADLGISIAGKLLETLGSEIVKEVCGMWNYKSELEKLEQTVSTIRDVLLDADAKRELNNQQRSYINNLKDAVYDADDLFDEFHTLAELNELNKPLSKRGKLFDKVRRFFSSENELGQAYRMSRDVKNIKMKLDDIADCRNKFGFSVDNGPISRRREDTCSYVEAKDIIGREEDKDAIIDKLLNDDENICCVTIVGVGGLGKTTLAQLVYNDEKVKKEFSDLRLWVCVSDQDGVDFDVKTILCKILEQVTNQTFDGSSTMQLVHNHLQEQLRGKKYLIVLDDVWNEDRKQWLSVEKFLMLGQGGSRIIVTTRSERTGTIIGEKNMYKLNGLSEENSWLLFELSAFNKEDKHENHHEFVKIGLKIVERCYNTPLAIKVVGSLLYGQELSKWRSFEDSGLSNIGKGDNEILSILKLSYHNLAPSLKSCFSYCALFPKDYELKKETLISLWMAQGYIMPLDGGQCIEDVAEEHFLILLRRCFFQDVRKNEYEDIGFVKIHDLMHDVAQEVGREEIQAVTTITNNLGDKIRHVRHVGDSLQESLLCSSKIRSLSLGNYQRDLVVTHIANWKCLRVLDLQASGVDNLPDSIGKLIHLRYLDLSENDGLKVLPDAITRLHNLQTLVLHRCDIKELPKNFCKLVKLRHLELPSNYSLNMPLGMDKLTSLKVLPFFAMGQKVSSKAQTYDELKPLKALTGIRGGIKIKIGKYYRKVEGMDDMEGGYLKGMKHLAKVEIEFDDEQGGWDNQECERVMETLEPPSNVKVLRIERYHGTIIPKWGRGVDDWAIFLSHLAKIELRSCTNLQEIPVLSKLPLLKSLYLLDLDNLEYLEKSNGSQASEAELFFPSLVELRIFGMKMLKGWWKGVDDNDCHRLNTTPLIFTRLSVLRIIDCPELTSFPPCPSLETLYLLRNNEGLQIKVGTRGKQDENEVDTPSTAKLRQLIIDNLSHLKSLPINCLTGLHIAGRLESEFETEANQESLAEEFQRCASSLQHLSIDHINNFERRLFGGSGLQHFTTLESLEFSSVTFGIKDEDEDGDNSLFWKSIPQNLRTLHLLLLGEVTSLPKGMQYLTSLQTLRLIKCDNLKSLPDWIDRFSSLQSLDISYCEALQSLPDSMQNLTSLQRLEIRFCSDELIRRCKEPDGECCPHIRHIPRIVLIDARRKCVSG